MDRSTILNGKINYFDWAMFNSYVKLPEGMYIKYTIRYTKFISI